MSRIVLYFQKFPGRGSVKVRCESASGQVLITAPMPFHYTENKYKLITFRGLHYYASYDTVNYSFNSF